MEWQFTPYAVPLFVGVGILAIIAALAWTKRREQGIIYLFWSCAVLCFAVLGYAFEIGSTTVEAVLFWLKFEYLGFAFAPVFLFMLALSYAGFQRHLTPLVYAILLAFSSLTLLFAWTNEHHELLWKDITLHRYDQYTGTWFVRGGWYWVNMVCTYLLILTGSALLARAFWRASGIYRKQLGVLLLGMVVPALVVVIRQTGLTRIDIDLSPYAFVVSAIIFSVGMLQYQLFDLMPVAREAVLNSMADAVIVLDNQRRVLDLNPAAQAILGKPITACVGKPAGEVFAEWIDSLAQYRGVEQAHDEVSLSVQGELRSFDLRFSPLQYRDRKQGYLLALRDITDRVRAITAMREAHERLLELRKMDEELSQKLEVHYVAEMALDTAMRISLASSAFIALQQKDGIRVIHALGSFMKDVINTPIPPDKGITARVIRTQEPAFVPDVTQDSDYLQVAEGTVAQITVPLISRDQVIGVLTLETTRHGRFTPEIFETVKALASRVGVAVDNARLYEDQDALVKELDAFAHTVAHDLKNPLSVVLAYAELIMTDKVLDENTREFATGIHRGGKKAVEIIEALLLLAGVRSAQTVAIVPLDMARLVNEVYARLKTMVKEYDAQVVLPESWLVAQGYAPWVEEVLANYFSNAIKYGGTPPCVELGCDTVCDDGFVRFWVRDNGEGLTLEEQAQLFRPFTRLQQVNIKGHGLGLSIVQRIVARLEGTVGVESVPGQGSRFYFTLPAA